MLTRKDLYRIFFLTETAGGRRFDVILLWVIVLSVMVVMLESVSSIGIPYRNVFFTLEWFFTIIFTIEYIMRIAISPRPFKYIFSVWGLIDLLSILPLYLSLFIYDYHYLLIIRIFRLLRVFRLMKVARFNTESMVLVRALKASSHKIGVFLWSVLSLVIFMGTLMYVVEDDASGFTSIPQSIYWAIVTITTVGYGDMVPVTVIGKMISSFIMVTGYAIIAVPTGIITVEMSRSNMTKMKCLDCNHDNDLTANYCNNCGHKLSKPVNAEENLNLHS